MDQPLKNPNAILLRTRTFAAAVEPDNHGSELDSRHVFADTRLNLKRTALLLIDVWETHPNDGWTARARPHIREKIVPLLATAREHGLLILHAAHEREIAGVAVPQPGEVDLCAEGLASTDAFEKFLKEREITTLLYAGYASNWCIINRPIGIIPMRGRGLNVILLRDCTLGFETPETLEGEWANKVIINTIEHQWGSTSTLEDLQSALKMRAECRALRRE